MEKVRILSIGTDKSILDEGGVTFTRQVEYFKNFEKSDVIILGVGKIVNLEKNKTNIVSFGGSGKITNFLTAFFNARKLIKNNNYNIIYTQDVLYCGILGYLLTFGNKAKFIPQIHGDYLNNPLWINQRKENIILNKIGIWLLKKTARIRCVSNRIVKQLVEEFKIPSEKVFSLPIGIDGDAFNTIDAKIPEERDKEILFVGRLIPEKEPLFFCDIVIPVLKKYPDFKVTVIGEGFLKNEMVKKFEDAGVSGQVSFPGFLLPMQLARYYKRAFVYVKTAFWEGWGLPMVESSACGLPCISTDTGCAGEVIINRKNGLLFDSRVAADFEKGLVEIIENKELYKELCGNAEALAKEWTFVAMREKIEKFLVDAVK